MRESCSLVWLALVGLFRSRASLEAEILILRHQLNIQRRQSPKRLNFSTLDRLIFAGLYRLAPSVLGALAILKPETVIRWHRAGFRSYWRWKSSRRCGRPTVPLEIRERDEYRQSTLGSATNSWRASQARHRNRTDQRGQVYGQAERPAVPGLEDVPPHSCRRHRGDGSVRRTDDLISLALWLVNCGAWSTTGFMVWRYRASDRRMDRKSDHASGRLEAGPSLSDPRPGRGLWRSLYSKSSIHGHS